MERGTELSTSRSSGGAARPSPACPDTSSTLPAIQIHRDRLFVTFVPRVGCWVLGVGCWVSSRLQHPTPNTQHPTPNTFSRFAPMSGPAVPLESKPDGARTLRTTDTDLNF